MSQTKENDDPFLIPLPCDKIRDDIHQHKKNRRHDMLINYVRFIILIEISSVGMSQIYLFPQTSEFQSKDPSYYQQNNFIFLLMNSIGLVFGIFSGYVNDFVVRKYAFLIYTFPRYINVLIQAVLVIFTICNANQIAEGSSNQIEVVRQMSIVISFIWHNLVNGMKVIMILIVQDYFVDYNYYWCFSWVLISFNDFSFFLHKGIYQIIVFSMNHNFYNESSSQNANIPVIQLPISFKISMFCIYSIIGFCSIYFYRKVLAILQERHDLEWKDRNLRDYHFVGKTKNNVFENYVYLFKKKTFITYLLIFIIFWNTSYFSWVSSFQNLYFEYYSQNSSMNIYTPINNVWNPLCSTIFTLLLSYQTRNVKNNTESIKQNHEVFDQHSKEEIIKNLNETLIGQPATKNRRSNNNNNNYNHIYNNLSKLDQYYLKNNLSISHDDQSQDILKNLNLQTPEQSCQEIDQEQLLKFQGKMGKQLDKYLRYSCLVIIIFTFFMLMTNAFLIGGNQQFSTTIKTIFLVLMYVCSSFIGTAYNFLYMSSSLKIIQIFKVRSKVLGSALSIVISAIFFFEYINSQLTYYSFKKQNVETGSFPTILYSIYFGCNALALFAMITLHSWEYRPPSLRS